ncbi:MAG: hypothetical protein ABIT01_06615 [Thermoanaerobaculia bacterium]
MPRARGRRTEGPALVLALVAGLSAGLSSRADAAPPPETGWPVAAERLLAADAARFAPPDLKRQIVKHRDRLMAGVNDARAAEPHTRDAAAHRAAAVRVARVIARKIREHQPFADVVYELGGIVHELAAASPPPNPPIPEGSSFTGYSSDPFGAPERLIETRPGYDASVTSATRLLTWIWKNAGGDCSSVKSFPETRGPFVIRE